MMPVVWVTSQPVEAEQFLSSGCRELRLRVLSCKKTFPILILTKHGLILRQSKSPIWKYKSTRCRSWNRHQKVCRPTVNVYLEPGPRPNPNAQVPFWMECFQHSSVLIKSNSHWKTLASLNHSMNCTCSYVHLFCRFEGCKTDQVKVKITGSKSEAILNLLLSFFSSPVLHVGRLCWPREGFSAALHSTVAGWQVSAP